MIHAESCIPPDTNPALLRGKAWIRIARPDDAPIVLAGSEAAVEEALAWPR
jgi:hypothetical protein